MFPASVPVAKSTPASDNILVFALHGTATESIETAAWVVILGLFELETRNQNTHARWMLVVAMLAYAVIVHSGYSYYIQASWIDLVNVMTWMAIVAVLQAEIYIPTLRLRHLFTLHAALKALLYGLLFVYVFLWAWEGAWMDTYDALLWLVSFFIIEMNIFKLEDGQARH